MLCEFEKTVLEFIRTEGLLPRTRTILLAVSGGADSTALLHCLWSLKAEGQLNSQLLCAHLNHQLRAAEADADQRFVVAQATDLTVPIVTRKLEVRKFARRNRLSLETAGRKLRIDALRQIALENGCDVVAAGHQKNDNAETVVQRLLRGTGFRGLGGIWPSRDFGDFRFVRPLLCVTRNQITRYLQNRKVTWRQDSTNADIRFHRNMIRHRLMPEIQRTYKGLLVEDLVELAQKARSLYKKIRDQAEQIWNETAQPETGKVILELGHFRQTPKAIQIELVRQSLEYLGCGEADFTKAHYDGIIELAHQKVSNRKMDLPGQISALRQYRRIVFDRNEQIGPPKQNSYSPARITVPGKTQFADLQIEAKIFEIDLADFEKFKSSKDASTEWFDFEKLTLPLEVRYRKAADRFVPLGLAGQKKVGKFLTDARIPEPPRSQILVVSDREKIIWLWPIRISELVKVTDQTKTVLQLRITRLNQPAI